MREHRLGEAPDRDHHRLDVEMRVDQAGDEVGAVGVDDLRLGPARVGGVAEHRDAPVADRDVHAVQHLARVDVDQTSAGDQQVCRLAAHADGGQRAADLSEALPGRTHARSSVCLVLEPDGLERCREVRVVLDARDAAVPDRDDRRVAPDRVVAA